jgi:class 3 adenylate cyclase
VDLVLSDINMPEMDGLTLLTKLHEMNPLLKAIIVSAYGDMDNIRTAMNRGAFDFVTKPINFEDLTITMEKTLEHVRHIRDTLRAVKENNILRMYVDENVLNFMGGQEYESKITASEQIEATVMFIDLCGFTTISEQAPPDVVVKLLNTYFDTIVKEIIASEGYVDKFIGDAVMAVFRGEYHLDRAIETALAIRDAIGKLPVEEGSDHYRPKVSIGVNSGEMVSGNIGSASLRRLDYTVIGDTVNIAARLQDKAAPNQILITESCYQSVKESFNFKELGEFLLKNKTEKSRVYEVLE